jgi:membrane protein implicated in regulation of membrane protease activity
MRTLVYSLIFSISGAASALAHGGHVGDLAGHSHWVGWAAAAAAGAVSAWAIKRGNKKKTDARDDADEAGNGEQPEAAEG